ncbi:MAG: altronate dehydratase large subunit [Kosmotogales bacterium]|nr:altronate dehydratase large subunit [Kosmotogales bacterium]
MMNTSLKNESKLFGYIREDGKIGFRNHVLILPTVSCSGKVALKISSVVAGCAVAYHNEGCGHKGEDYIQVMRTLKNTALNPNVASVLLVGLGCEKTSPFELKEEIENDGKNVEMLLIKDCGTRKTVEKGIEIAKKMVEDAAKIRRKEVPLDSIVLGVECGGSDFSSGLAANPVVGKTSDKVIANGGSVILSEITELIGAEKLFKKRMKNDLIKEKFYEKVNFLKNESRKNRRARVDGLDMPNCISPGNVRGGLSTIEEKALGAAIKGGTQTIQDVIDYSELLKEKGLTIMNSPGYDIESVTGMVASGANVIIFTSGIGSPTGNPIVPVIKVTGNDETYLKMKENIDFDASGILDGRDLIDYGNELFKVLIDIVNGEKCKAEIEKQDDFSIWNLGIKL